MSGGIETSTDSVINDAENGDKNSVREKSREAFRTISEVSKHLDLPQHVLRFWETKFPQVSPMKRGGGRRYYRPEDVAILSRIRSLLHDEGYTIKGVQKLLKKPGAISSLQTMSEKIVENNGENTVEKIAQGEPTAPTTHANSPDSVPNSGIFNVLSRHEAEKLLGELVAVREGLKKFS